ncbi:MAG: TetR family transcriptional regulator [Pseudomonadota bacterium]
MADVTLTVAQKKGAYHHGDLRQALLEATRELVELKGPTGFSVSEACRLAGVSTAAPYRHFFRPRSDADRRGDSGDGADGCAIRCRA